MELEYLKAGNEEEVRTETAAFEKLEAEVKPKQAQ